MGYEALSPFSADPWFGSTLTIPLNEPLMYITSPDPKTRHLEVFDFWFENGMVFTISVDKEAGDTIDWDTSPSVVRIHLTTHPHNTNPEIMIPAEDHTIFIKHVIRLIKHEEEAMPLTTEQQLALRATVQEITKGSRYKM